MGMPLALTISGLLIGLVGVALRWSGVKPELISLGGMLVGGALLIAGLASLYFIYATRRSFEWLIAWRYLHTSKRSFVALGVGGGLLLLGVGLIAGTRLVDDSLMAEITGGVSNLKRQLQAGAMVCFALASWSIFFGVLMLTFSVFTSISVLGVYLGTLVLVVVLSVMGGFEHDLRRKILGTRAHVVVTKPRKMFADYREVMSQVAKTSGVSAVAPYLEGEVMITSQTNLSAALLRGIDPKRILRVTDLRAHLKAKGGAGSLENLIHPERLAKIPAIPVLRPRKDDVKSPKGGQPASQPAAGAKPSSRPAALPDGSDYRGVGPKIPPRPVYPGIIVGAELARNLRLYLGDDVNVISPLGGMSPAGPMPKSRPFRVAGIFYSGMYEYDTKFVYMTIPSCQRFLGLDDEITGLEVKANDAGEAEQLATALRKALGGAFEVKDWQRLNRNLFTALKLEKIAMFIVLTFIVVVAAFAIVITLTMIVLEKTREIAALKAIGASHWSLLKVFMFAGLYVGVIGMLVGVVEGVAICSVLQHVGLPLDPEVYYISRLPVRVDWMEMLVVSLSAVSLSFAATIHPAVMAARLKPVEGLRYD